MSLFLKCNNFVNNLKNADSEKLIEAIYHTELKKQINKAGGQVIGIQTGNKTDGILTAEFLFNGKLKVLNLIIETKYAETFSYNLVRAKVLAQIIYYLKSIYNSGNELPNIVFVGDSDECFVLHTNLLQGYLQINYDWTIAPSKAGITNIALVDSLCNNSDIQKQCFVFTIDDNFLMHDVVDRIVNLVNNVKLEVRITERSISRVFDHFSMRVLKKNADGSSKCSSRKQVEFFMNLVLNTEDCFRHPQKRDTAIFKGKEAAVYSDAFDALLEYYSFDYNAEDKKSFTGICDRLLEDSERRKKGDFYTPTIWVDESHKLLSKCLGTTWKDEYMIWDCACGTLNLTRDYKFFDLYCSTLSKSDLRIGNKYNQEAASKFQYDFLNDDVIVFDELLKKVNSGHKLSEKDFFGSELWYKAPSLIRGMLNGKKLLFFINPPYGTSKSGGAVEGNSKVGISSTLISKAMKSDNLGYATRQLYLQFLYSCIRFKKLFKIRVCIGVFCPSAIYTYTEYTDFREYALNICKFRDSFILQASNFADVAPNWGICFSLLDSSLTKPQNIISEVKVISDGDTSAIGIKKMYALNNLLKVSTLCRKGLKGIKSKETVYLKTPLNSGKTKRENAQFIENFIGGFWCNSNIVEKNSQFVSLWSAMAGYPACFSITKDTYADVTCYYTARKLITGKYATWVNGKDEYMIPNKYNENYHQWENDCIVYSLFNVASNQSSLRGTSYNNKQWNVINNFFFMSKDKIKELALGVTYNDAVYEDIQNYAKEERFVYNKLQKVNLSLDAQVVLDKANELVVDSFKYRKYFDQERPEYYINTWDAGWYQIKGLLKVYMPEGLKEFNILYKQFEDRMRPLVYELGYLYK